MAYDGPHLKSCLSPDITTFHHSIVCRGGVYASSSQVDRREEPESEYPVVCRDYTSFDFHPTWASVLGAALRGHQVVQMFEPAHRSACWFLLMRQC
jgi:hypothetical protein